MEDSITFGVVMFSYVVVGIVAAAIALRLSNVKGDDEVAVSLLFTFLWPFGIVMGLMLIIGFIPVLVTRLTRPAKEEE